MTTVYEKMKEKKAACNHPEADTLFCSLPWPKNLTNIYAKMLLSGLCQSVEISGNLSAEICAKYVKYLNLKY